MADKITSNKVIAKNTFFLYFRMVVTMVVNLFTVREVLAILGVDDYGIYNVVGGVVAMFQFLNAGMVASSQRFISYELGTGDEERLAKVFHTSKMVHLLLALLILLLGETVGLWFVNSELNIPEGRYGAANWVYQCSLLALMITTVSVPYNACIVAHEHMKVFGYFGIAEALLKLLIVFMLVVIPGDKLIVYAILVVAVSISLRVGYSIYCHRRFEECRTKRSNDSLLAKQMFSFAGWSFIGNFGFAIRTQGLTIVLNMMFNVALNAAKGIATQVNAVILGLVTNFQMAINPQITKRYASGNIKSMMDLVFRGSKYSFFLFLIVVVPLFVASEQVLSLWLASVPPYASGFLKLMLLMSLVDSLAGPLVTAMQADGRIRTFQVVICLVMCLSIPIAWVWLTFVKDPYIVVYAGIITSVIGLAARLRILHGMIPFSYAEYSLKVLLPCVAAVAILFPLNLAIYRFFPLTIWGLVGFVLVSIVAFLAVVSLVGLTKGERTKIFGMLAKKFPCISRTS